MEFVLDAGVVLEKEIPANLNSANNVLMQTKNTKGTFGNRPWKIINAWLAEKELL
jgi:hypothetical protein